MSTHNISFSISMGLNNKFKTAMVNKPSVFKPQKFYCILDKSIYHFRGVRPILLILFYF